MFSYILLKNDALSKMASHIFESTVNKSVGKPENESKLLWIYQVKWDIMFKKRLIFTPQRVH